MCCLILSSTNHHQMKLKCPPAPTPLLRLHARGTAWSCRNVVIFCVYLKCGRCGTTLLPASPSFVISCWQVIKKMFKHHLKHKTRPCVPAETSAASTPPSSPCHADIQHISTSSEHLQQTGTKPGWSLSPPPPPIPCRPVCHLNEGSNWQE